MTAASPTRRTTRPGTLAFLTALGVAVLGIAFAAAGLLEAGVFLVAGALLLCAVVRLVLSDQSAGLLRLRRKNVDVATCALLALGIIVVFVSLPSRG
jgi:multisubunit Na+/H+ antiporter MnhB subunit